MLSDEIKKAASKLIARLGNEIRGDAYARAPKKTGKLRDDIKRRDKGKYVVEVGNSSAVPYAPHVHYGTGVYGKNKKPITPKNAKALKTPFGFRKSVKGQKPRPYLDDALKNYRDGGGLDRALKEAGEELTKTIANNVRVAFDRFK
ncbi:MAG: HK97 gp10 family phage protein [Helicobacteraceae bacterium]|jgi:HK97 gp10 family phage protein|nr:HK97 gp10 family phage protein [Helicobacteraceae bacterium]